MRRTLIIAACAVAVARPSLAQSFCAPDVCAPATQNGEPHFSWKGTLAQSGFLLGVQHTLRLAQKKTRDHLGGPFWADYVDSVQGLHGWDDGNPWITNYGGHPMMGGIT